MGFTGEGPAISSMCSNHWDAPASCLVPLGTAWLGSQPCPEELLTEPGIAERSGLLKVYLILSITRLVSHPAHFSRKQKVTILDFSSSPTWTPTNKQGHCLRLQTSHLRSRLLPNKACYNWLIVIQSCFFKIYTDHLNCFNWYQSVYLPAYPFNYPPLFRGSLNFVVVILFMPKAWLTCGICGL